MLRNATHGTARRWALEFNAFGVKDRLWRRRRLFAFLAIFARGNLWGIFDQDHDHDSQNLSISYNYASLHSSLSAGRGRRLGWGLLLEELL